MSNLRVIYDNAADRATLTSSATQGSLGVSNLLSDVKSKVCRSAGTSLSVYATWPSAETIGCAAFAFTNLSPTTTARVRLTNESSITNLFTYSEQFDNAAWLSPASRATVTANSIASPDGNTTADLITANGSGAAYYYQGRAMTAGATYVISVFFKAGTYTGSLNITDYTEAGVASFNMTTKVASASGKASLPVMTDMGGGWYRCSATFKPTTGGTHNIGFGGISTATTFYMWGAQMELNYYTSYYPSVAAQGVRPTGYIDSWQTYTYDSGTVLFCPAPYKIIHGLTTAQAVSAYAYGGGKYACLWFPSKQAATGLAIDIVDTNNAQGYVEVSRLICGDYWAPTNSVVDVSNTTLQVVDTSSHTRTDAGDLYTYVGTKHRKQAINMPSIDSVSRKQLWDIMFGNGMSKPMFISLYPGNSDASLEANHMLYGKLSTSPVMSTPYFSYAAATIEIEEV